MLEGTHLLGMALMMAPVMMYDFRLIGVRWKADPVAKVKWGFLPITFFGFALMIVTGVLLLLSEPVKCYKSGYFRLKLAALILAEHPRMSVDDLRKKLLASTDPIVALKGKTATGGRINAAKALE